VAPPRAPAPAVTPSVPPPPQVQAPVVAPPVATVSTPAPAAASNTPSTSPLGVTMNSLTALANATELTEKKPAAAPPDPPEKQRKEPRLATPVSHSVPRPEPKPQELPEATQQGIAMDGSQRPQRWGFWRGNR